MNEKEIESQTNKDKSIELINLIDVMNRKVSMEINDRERERGLRRDMRIILQVEELNDNVKKMESEIKNEREEKEEIKMEKNKWKIDKEIGDEKMEIILEEMKQLRITVRLCELNHIRIRSVLSFVLQIGAGDEQNIKMGEKISILMEEKSKSEDTREMMKKEKEMLVDNIKKMEIELEQLRVTVSRE